LKKLLIPIFVIILLVSTSNVYAISEGTPTLDELFEYIEDIWIQLNDHEGWIQILGQNQADMLERLDIVENTSGNTDDMVEEVIIPDIHELQAEVLDPELGLPQRMTLAEKAIGIESNSTSIWAQLMDIDTLHSTIGTSIDNFMISHLSSTGITFASLFSALGSYLDGLEQRVEALEGGEIDTDTGVLSFGLIPYLVMLMHRVCL